ncbi:MAG: glycogen/starch synthase [Muribaculum sp.]|nr:glycogen/starch synthase [Muribaculaceae bacterium]MCM1080558.1 glycogen/starch synthase [Muribaculum sp.]
MELNKVLYISQEIVPYLTPSPLATLSQKLPQGVLEKGVEVRTFMPKYGCIKERRNQLHEVIRLSGLNIVIDDADHPLIIKVATLQPARMQVYFIDNEDYFYRTANPNELETTAHPEDNDERIMFYVRGVVETVKKLRWYPSLVHCSGWVSSLAPMYLKRIYADDPALNNPKVVFSLSNDTFDTALDSRMQEKLKQDGFNDDDLAAIGSKPLTWLDLQKLAIDYSDGIVQSAETIDPEVLAYAQQSGKPFMPYPGEEEFVDKYLDFYKSL